jgi:hypothetical protein
MSDRSRVALGRIVGRKHNVTETSFCRRLSKHGGIEVSDARKLKITAVRLAR